MAKVCPKFAPYCACWRLWGLFATLLNALVSQIRLGQLLDVVHQAVQVPLRNGVLPRGSYLGPHRSRCNKAVCTCAVCSEFYISFKSHECKSTVYQRRKPKTRKPLFDYLGRPCTGLAVCARIAMKKLKEAKLLKTLFRSVQNF